MRFLGLLASSSLLVVASVALADDHRQAPASAAIPLLSEHFSWNATSNSAVRQLRLPLNWGHENTKAFSVVVEGHDLPITVEYLPGQVCYSLETYHVERDAPDSDSVHPVGSANCQTASRFAVKGLDQRNIETLQNVLRENSPEVK